MTRTAEPCASSTSADARSRGEHRQRTRAHRLAMRGGPGHTPRFTVGWHDAVFEHYRIVDEDAIARLLPAPLVLDRHEGDAWISVVSFRMVAMRWRGLRVPFAHTYAQVNVRTYVRHADKFGVFFLRNLVANRLAAWAGRWMYGLPYVHANLRAAETRHRHDSRVGYSEDSGPNPHRVSGRIGQRQTGHEENPEDRLHFLLERYPLFSVRAARPHVAAMLHSPWHVYELEDVERSEKILASLALSDAVRSAPEVQYSPGVDTLMWAPAPLSRDLHLAPRSSPPARRLDPAATD